MAQNNLIVLSDVGLFCAILLLGTELGNAYIPSERKVVNSMPYKYFPRRVHWAYSLVHLNQLALYENEIYELMKNCTVKLKGDHNLLDDMKMWTSYYESSTLAVTGPLTHLNEDTKTSLISKFVTSNPIVTYMMVERFTSLLQRIIFPLPENTEVICGSIPLLKKIAQIYTEFVLPGSSDLDKIIDNILRISLMYKLSPESDMRVARIFGISMKRKMWPLSFIRGNIGKLQTIGLSTRQAINIASTAYDNGYNMQSMDWYYAAYKLNRNPDISPDIIRGMEEIIVKRSDVPNKQSFTRNLKMKAEDPGRYASRIFNLVMSRYEELLKKPSPLEEIFEELCRGTFPQDLHKNPKLYCWYEKQTNVIWRLIPLKMELLNEEIELTQIHDAFGDKTTSTMIQHATTAFLAKTEPNIRKSNEEIVKDKTFPGVEQSKNALTRSTVDVQTAKEWAASVAALQPNPDIVELNRKIGRITGFIVDNTEVKPPLKASDDIHVNSYTFGGHHGIHFDETAGVDMPNGDLMTTFMIYLNEVEQGGSTVFPHIGVQVSPEKGSAIFWHNFRRNGLLNKKTQHGGCTIISGSKWGTTTWIHSNANFLRRKCSLDPSE